MRFEKSILYYTYLHEKVVLLFNVSARWTGKSEVLRHIQLVDNIERKIVLCKRKYDAV